MTDQDHDGSHIKGLLINFISKFWPKLLRSDGFISQFITPIVKATKRSRGRSSSSSSSSSSSLEHSSEQEQRTRTFYTLPEYEAWKGRREAEGGRGMRGWGSGV